MTWLSKLFRSQYVRLLEEERARLLAEQERFRETITRLNKEKRNLTNMLLGAAGHPPIDEGERNPLPHVARRSLHQMQLHTERKSLLKVMDRERRENGSDAHAIASKPEPDSAA